jgi:EAL and modified HD-GYP domain-containing signal transduction protein
MIDGQGRIVGYRFKVSPSCQGTTLTPPQIAEALRQDQLAAFTRKRQAFVRLNATDWDTAEFSEFISPHTWFFVPTPAPTNTVAALLWRQTLDAIQQAGGQIVVDGRALTPTPTTPLPWTIHGLLIDFDSQQLEAIEALVRRVQQTHPQIRLIADGLNTWHEMRWCHALGIHVSLGDYATKPDEQAQGKHMSQSRLVLLEMLNLLRREGNPAEIAAIAKRDPIIAVKLIGMANSPLAGLSAPVASVEQAMLVLGREAIYRWLSLSLFRTGHSEARDETLLELALFRSRFLELMAAECCPKTECDELFLVGLLSLIDNLLGITMPEFLAKLHLPTAVADVLLGNGGPYSRWLMLALAIERGSVDTAEKLTASLGASTERITSCITEARGWTAEIMQVC